MNLNSTNRMADAHDAIAMIFEGGQYWLPGWCIGFILSVAILNYSCKDINIKHRVIVQHCVFFSICRDKESFRNHLCSSTPGPVFLTVKLFKAFFQLCIILIWAVFLVPLGPELCRVQDHFSWTAVMVSMDVFDELLSSSRYLSLAYRTPDSHRRCVDLQ